MEGGGKVNAIKHHTPTLPATDKQPEQVEGEEEAHVQDVTLVDTSKVIKSSPGERTFRCHGRLSESRRYSRGAPAARSPRAPPRKVTASSAPCRTISRKRRRRRQQRPPWRRQSRAGREAGAGARGGAGRRGRGVSLRAARRPLSRGARARDLSAVELGGAGSVPSASS